eukprot:11171534-Lingulodinium_polyedra.AAC.1
MGDEVRDDRCMEDEEGRVNDGDFGGGGTHGAPEPGGGGGGGEPVIELCADTPGGGVAGGGGGTSAACSWSARGAVNAAAPAAIGTLSMGFFATSLKNCCKRTVMPLKHNAAETGF